MTPFFAYGLMASGAAVASRWCHLSRGIGAGMIVAGAIVLATPAWADEHVLARDNSEVSCTVSKTGLTRVSLKDDRFASVSKLTTGVEADDFTVVNEPTRGDIYLSVPEGFSRSKVSFFGTTAKGYVYKFACRLGADDAQQVFVENKDIVAGENAPEIAKASVSPQEASATLVQAMYQSSSLDGFDVIPAGTDPVMVGTLKVQMVTEYRGAALAGRVLKIENKGRQPVSLGEGTIAPSNAIAVSVANPQLKPGEATTAYIVTPAGLANGVRP
ncbi:MULTISPECIES: type-F conjugative transfer system secretin TraK [Alphaproteobacteria]|jgi:conjugal transfer pilus assembly protein TraK|uniref:type-F conjugative transfer system secretin TraK n=1 Tax=Alphaproteobacteria TaxID=28211 RepID=UPI0026074C88|nr:MULTISPECIES: type-F conjugative transfer system secretin TraK [Alphaproteobacteria]